MVFSAAFRSVTSSITTRACLSESASEERISMTWASRFFVPDGVSMSKLMSWQDFPDEKTSDTASPRGWRERSSPIGLPTTSSLLNIPEKEGFAEITRISFETSIMLEGTLFTMFSVCCFMASFSVRAFSASSFFSAVCSISAALFSFPETALTTQRYRKGALRTERRRESTRNSKGPSVRFSFQRMTITMNSATAITIRIFRNSLDGLIGSTSDLTSRTASFMESTTPERLFIYHFLLSSGLIALKTSEAGFLMRKPVLPYTLIFDRTFLRGWIQVFDNDVFDNDVLDNDGYDLKEEFHDGKTTVTAITTTKGFDLQVFFDKRRRCGRVGTLKGGRGGKGG